MAGPVMPSANDTLMTLWNLYSRQQRVHSPPQQHRKPELPLHRKLDSVSPAPQSEALNLGVQREATRYDSGLRDDME